VSGKNNLWTSMSWPGGQHIRAGALDRHFSGFEAATQQLVVKKISDGTFIRSDGFDIDQASGKGEQVHAAKE